MLPLRSTPAEGGRWPGGGTKKSLEIDLAIEDGCSDLLCC
jgi:hypothetical protein